MVTSDDYIINNPLVAVIGIGEYDGLPNLVGINKDYENLIYTFHKMYKHNILYCNNNNKIKDIKSFDQSGKSNYKIRWTSDEIDLFLEKAKNKLKTKEYDAFLLFISSHGDSEGTLYDSDCEEYQVSSILNRFNGENCIEMAFKPKLIFLDACRGSMKSKAVKLSSTGTIEDISVITNDQTLTTDATMVEKGGISGIFSQKNKKFKNNKKKPFEQQLRVLKVHKEGNFRLIYSNIEGYSAIDSTKGGYLMRATKDIFCSNDMLEDWKSYNMDKLIKNIRGRANQLASTDIVVQTPVDENRCEYDIYFARYDV